MTPEQLTWIANVSQVAGAVVATVALVVAGVSLYLQRNKKSLVYEIVTNTTLISISETEKEAKKDIKILYRGEEVSEVRLIEIRFRNNGNLEIMQEDFRDIPITVHFKGRILSEDVEREKGLELEPIIILLPNNDANHASASIHPLHFKNGESFRLKLLVSEFSEPITVEGRIIGVREIKEINSEVVQYQWIGVISAFMASAIGFITWWFADSQTNYYPELASLMRDMSIGVWGAGIFALIFSFALLGRAYRNRAVSRRFRL